MPATSQTTVPARVDFGLDAPAFYRKMLPIGVALWAAFFLLQRLPPPLVARGGMQALLSVCAASGGWLLASVIVAFFSSRWGKLWVARSLIGRMGLSGSEEILDLGCGRGLAGITAAQYLQTLRPHVSGSERVTGVDIWKQEDLAGNAPERAVANAAAAGVAEDFRVRHGDARQLPFADASFDALVSMTCLHNIHGAAERRRALAEIARVLRPGGRAALFDILHTGEYAAYFRGQGWAVRRSGLIPLWCMPGRYLLLRKPN
ncbi:MAG: class I SAM-dependent methyltransferase [Terriglobales bacterium]